MIFSYVRVPGSTLSAFQFSCIFALLASYHFFMALLRCHLNVPHPFYITLLGLPMYTSGICMTLSKPLCFVQEKSYHGYGTTDGIFQCTRFFTCKDDCGLFVALDRISAVRDHGSAHTEPSREGPSQHHNQKYGLRSQSKPPKDSSVDAESRFKVGERVIVYNKKDVAIRGTVKWIGVITYGKEYRVSTVGIETVSATT